MNRILLFTLILVLLTSCTYPKPFDFQSDNTFLITVSGAIEHPTTLITDPFPTIEEILQRVRLLPESDLSALNLQTILHHKDVLYIPYKKVIPCVSINSGSLADLDTLIGIGEKTAQAIIDYRTSVGLFQKIEDLLNVKGIGQKTLAKFKDRLCL